MVHVLSFLDVIGLQACDQFGNNWMGKSEFRKNNKIIKLLKKIKIAKFYMNSRVEQSIKQVKMWFKCSLVLLVSSLHWLANG